MAKRPASQAPSPITLFRKLRALDPLPQLACAAFSVEVAMGAYPLWLRERFHYEQALELAWRHVAASDLDAEEVRALATVVSDSFSDGEGIERAHAGMSGALLEAIIAPSLREATVAVVAAIEHGGRAWAVRPGTGASERDADPDGFEGPVYARLEQALRVVELNHDPLTRAMFDAYA